MLDGDGSSFSSTWFLGVKTGCVVVRDGLDLFSHATRVRIESPIQKWKRELDDLSFYGWCSFFLRVHFSNLRLIYEIRLKVRIIIVAELETN